MAGMDACVRMRPPKKFLSLNRSLLALLIYNRIFPDIGLNLIMMARIGDQMIVRSNDHFSSDFLSFNIRTDKFRNSTPLPIGNLFRFEFRFFQGVQPIPSNYRWIARC